MITKKRAKNPQEGILMDSWAVQCDQCGTHIIHGYLSVLTGSRTGFVNALREFGWTVGRGGITVCPECVQRRAEKVKKRILEDE